MSKPCARCEKTVYPMEELKSLDKTWHKGCFKCQECNMTLSMKTYKGFNKLPYCEAHIPKAKATAVAETPEMKRLAENTKIQSNVQYHADFEKSKTRFTQVADDPETLRLKINTKNSSNVAYHGDLKRKEEMERKRTADDDEAATRERQHEQQQMDQLDQLQNLHIKNQQQHVAATAAQPTYNAKPQQQAYQQPKQAQQPAPANVNYQRQQQTNNNAYQQQQQQQPPQQQQQPSQQQPQPSAVPKQFRDNNQTNNNSPYSSRNSQTLVYSSQPGAVAESGGRGVGSIADYDPINEQFGSMAQPRGRTPQYQHPSSRPQQSYADNSSGQQHYQQQQYGAQPQPQQPQQPQQQQKYAQQQQHYAQQQQYGQQQQQPYAQQQQYGQQQQPQQPYGQQPQQYIQQQQQQQQQQQPPAAQQQYAAQPPQQQQQTKITAQPTNLGRCYQAMYDYEASDTDEISFQDGDLIINCSGVDEGWMTGTVQRTNRTGMLPANYVKRVS